MDIDAAAFSDKKICQTAVVGVQMCKQDVPAVRVRAQLGQSGFECYAAGIPAEAGIDQQIRLLSADKVAVQLFSGVSRRRNTDTVNISEDFFYHKQSFLRCHSIINTAGDYSKSISGNTIQKMYSYCIICTKQSRKPKQINRFYTKFH